MSDSHSHYLKLCEQPCRSPCAKRVKCLAESHLTNLAQTAEFQLCRRVSSSNVRESLLLWARITKMILGRRLQDIGTVLAQEPPSWRSPEIFLTSVRKQCIGDDQKNVRFAPSSSQTRSEELSGERSSKTKGAEARLACLLRTFLPSSPGENLLARATRANPQAAPAAEIF